MRKAWNIVSSLLVAAVVLLALLLVGARVVGLQVFTVLSGSMEPTYHTGSLIYVKKVDPSTVTVGQPITFMLDENTVATHRVVGIVPDEEDPTVLRFRTKGDANEAEDGALVHYKNIIGTPVFSIPYLGYVASYIQHPPGMYVAISAGAVLLLLVFLPDLFAGDEDKKEKQPGKPAKQGAFSAPRHAAPRPVPTADDLTELIRRRTKGLLTDQEIETLRRQVEENRFDQKAAASLRQLLLTRMAQWKSQNPQNPQ